ncbi:MAG: Gfo/Idh/MocA family oxidoreductase [Dehalococcoidia bacterium]
MADLVRIAVIGAGSMGANHARVLAELPDAELVAVCDADEARARAAAHGAKAYRDYRDLLAREQLDAITIAVPTRLHAEVALACIDRALPLLVEKPLGADLDECLRLRDAAVAADVPLMVGHVERFNPVVQEIKRCIEGGEFGRVFEVQATRIGPFFERERDVGVVHDLATHDIDVLRYVFASEITHVSAITQSGIRTPFEDALTALLRLDNGVAAALNVNWLSPDKDRTLWGAAEGCTFTGRLWLGSVQINRGGQPADLDVRQLRDRGEPLRHELEAFLRVARREEGPTVTADDAVAAMRVVEALIESARSGETVRLTAEGAAK